MGSNLGIVIQARMGSTRYPGKMLTELEPGSSLLELIIKKIKRVAGNLPIILATSIHDKDDPLIEIAESYQISVFRGSEEDVLDRFVNAMEQLELTHAIRVCGDNPYLDSEFLQQLIKVGSKSNDDYVSFRINRNLPVIKSHFGFFSEFVALNALKKVQLLTEQKLYHEHVTNFLYEHPDQFSIHWIEVPEFIDANTNIRLTFDTPEDLDHIHMVSKIARKSIMDITAKEICDIVNNSRELKDRMKFEIEKNHK